MNFSGGSISKSISIRDPLFYFVEEKNRYEAGFYFIINSFFY